MQWQFKTSGTLSVLSRNIWNCAKLGLHSCFNKFGIPWDYTPLDFVHMFSFQERSLLAFIRCSKMSMTPNFKIKWDKQIITNYITFCILKYRCKQKTNNNYYIGDSKEGSWGLITYALNFEAQGEVCQEEKKEMRISEHSRIYVILAAKTLIYSLERVLWWDWTKGGIWWLFVYCMHCCISYI